MMVMGFPSEFCTTSGADTFSHFSLFDWSPISVKDAVNVFCCQRCKTLLLAFDDPAK
jgi:hypothetical protein